MNTSLKHYLVVTLAYWGFTITDGAIRMLVVLYFHRLGYSPLDIAFLFLFYEFLGVVTNLLGGWISTRLGLNTTMHLGMALQVVALALLGGPDHWLSVPFVMGVQALSGIAKDLNKMSAKSSVKLFADSGEGLFRWVAVLTGSKNALKGFGYFAGGFLLTTLDFRGAVFALAGSLLLVLVITLCLLPKDLGKLKAKVNFKRIFSQSRNINTLSAARLFLFGSRDIWFVVGLPVFMIESLKWNHTAVGTFMAAWIIIYGFVQAASPKLLRRGHGGQGPDGRTAFKLVFALAIIPGLIALALNTQLSPQWVLIGGLTCFGALFAVNSSVHSFLILDYADAKEVALDVGFYYMANAAGRLIGTVLSGLLYLEYGLLGTLWASSIFLIIASLFSLRLPRGAS